MIGCILQHFFLKLRSLMFHITEMYSALGFLFHLRKKILTVHQANCWRQKTYFMCCNNSEYVAFTPNTPDIRDQRQFSGLEKADDERVHGDLCLQSDHRPIPVLSIFMMNNHYFWSIEKTKLKTVSYRKAQWISW